MTYLDTIDRLARIAASADAIIKQTSPMFDVHKIEPWYGCILDYLTTQSAPVPVTELVTALHRPKSSMTKATDRLESAGYVTKTRNPHDGRGVLVQLTPSGKVALARFRTAYRKADKTLFKGIEKEEIVQMLARMEANVR